MVAIRSHFGSSPFRGKGQQALRLLDAMDPLTLRLKGTPEASSDPADVVPARQKFASAVRECAIGRGQWKQAMLLLGDMKGAKISPDLTTFFHAISACKLGGGKWEQALGLLGSMYTVTVDPHNLTTAAAIATCAIAGQQEQAIQLLDAMPATNLNPVHLEKMAYNMPMYACATSSQWEIAIRLLDHMKHKNIKPSGDILNSALHACQDAGQRTHAWRILHDARLAKVKLEGFHDTKATNWEEALKLQRLMKERNVDKNAFSLHEREEIAPAQKITRGSVGSGPPSWGTSWGHLRVWPPPRGPWGTLFWALGAVFGPLGPFWREIHVRRASFSSTKYMASARN